MLAFLEQNKNQKISAHIKTSDNGLNKKMRSIQDIHQFW